MPEKLDLLGEDAAETDYPDSLIASKTCIQQICMPPDCLNASRMAMYARTNTDVASLHA